MARIVDLKQAAATACAVKIGGIEKLWIIDNSDISSVTFTETAGKDAVVSAITLGATKHAVEFEFTQDKTAFFNEAQANTGDPVDQTVSIFYDGLSTEKVDVANGLIGACAMSCFVKYKSGLIRFVGYDYDVATDTSSVCPTPLRAKISTASGVGNNDAERLGIELIGQGKYLSHPTSLTESALNAL